jgi:hypothetical protein
MYDCHDLLSGFHDICSEIVTAEATVFESADLVRFSSPWLDVAAIRPCEKNRSSSEMASIRLIDPSLQRPGKPVIGHAGSFDFWFDLEAIRRAAIHGVESG